MPRAYIAVGSNIDPARHVLAAVRRLARAARVLGVSTVYRTAPENRPEQSPYYNGVVAVATGIPPLDFKRGVLRTIEQELGRVRSADPYAARTIDLDLVLYDDLVVQTADLTLPDPHIRQRAYLARGLQELAPDLILPGTGQPVAAVAASLAPAALAPLPGFTARLRRAIRTAEHTADGAQAVPRAYSEAH